MLKFDMSLEQEWKGFFFSPLQGLQSVENLQWETPLTKVISTSEFNTFFMTFQCPKAVFNTTLTAKEYTRWHFGSSVVKKNIKRLNTVHYKKYM